MDHWGDPWLDDDAKPPPKPELKTPRTPPPPLPLAAAPVAFLDDARWGSVEEEEGFGGWGTHSRTTDAGTPAADAQAIPVSDALTTGPPVDTGGWGGFEYEQETLWEPENGVSAASDSGTTIQPDENRESRTTDSADAIRPDDASSTRPSTSPSDVSHPEAPTDSPRTSFEDEQLTGKTVIGVAPLEENNDQGSVETRDSADNELAVQESIQSPQTELMPAGDDTEQSHELRAPNPPAEPPVKGPQPDLLLLAQLFPPIKSSKPLPPAPDSPIDSISARKAWYRLTREQTMREFNSGGNDSNYVRVTWANSQIRTEVTKIVSRWATEDRISGRGPGGRVSFYWDQPARPENKVQSSHPRKPSVMSLSSTVQPTKQRVQPITAAAPAAFSWNSPSTELDPWKTESPSIRAVSSPLAANPTGSTVLQQGSRPASVDLTPRKGPLPSHKKTTSVNHINGTANHVSETITHETSPLPPSLVEDSKAVDTVPNNESTDAAMGDDDDWGEMVESPAFPPVPSIEPPRNTDRSASPSYTKSPSPQPAPPKHAAAIVRLKGTVSPITFVLPENSLVAGTTEIRKIGPGLLKPTNKTLEVTRGKSRATPSSTSGIDAVLGNQVVEPLVVAQPDPEPAEKKEPASFQSLAPDTPPVTISSDSATPPSPKELAQTPPRDWSDADFSIFEQSLLSTSIPPATQTPDPIEPSPAFEARTPPTIDEISPPKTPQPSVSDSAQDRKTAEDDIIRSIVSGFPDLSYMLRY